MAPLLREWTQQELSAAQAQEVLSAGTALAAANHEKLAEVLPSLVSVTRTFGGTYAENASIIHNASDLMLTSVDGVATAALKLSDRFGPLGGDLRTITTLMAQFSKQGLLASAACCSFQAVLSIWLLVSAVRKRNWIVSVSACLTVLARRVRLLMCSRTCSRLGQDDRPGAVVVGADRFGHVVGCRLG